jgi:hypothetical protein
MHCLVLLNTTYGKVNVGAGRLPCVPAGLTSSSARRGLSRALAALIVVLGTMAMAHGGRIAQNLPRHHWEDWRFFRHNKANIDTLAHCFTRPSAWPGLYRPLSTNAYYLVGRRLFGNRIEAYHLVNAAVFAANAWLLFLLCSRRLPGWWALLPAALFASRVAHTQVVCFASEFQALSSTFLILLATHVFLEGRARERWALELGALIPFVLALLCKETVVVWPAILAAHGRLFDRAGSWLRYLPPVAAAAAWAALFVMARRAVGGGEPTGFLYDVSLAVIGRGAAYLLTFSNLLSYSGKLDTPLPPRVEVLAATPVVQGAFVLMVLVALFLFVRRPARTALRVAAFGFAWFLLAIAPFLFFQDRLFMRYGYLGHAGLSVSVAALLLAMASWAQEKRALTSGA